MDGRLTPVAAAGARRLYMGPYGKEDNHLLIRKKAYTAINNIFPFERHIRKNTYTNETSFL